MTQVPVRVDFAGGWLDVPELAMPGGYIVNCAISPMVSIGNWPYQKRAGLGGSAAHAILTGRNCLEQELALGAGWQEAAVIVEIGLCVWRSAPKPTLEMKQNPDWLTGLMAIRWMGLPHDTPEIKQKKRDYDAIVDASLEAKFAVIERRITDQFEAVEMSYDVQIREGMGELPTYYGSVRKYLGSGWGGYALYLFLEKEKRDVFILKTPNTMAVEPYMKPWG